MNISIKLLVSKGMDIKNEINICTHTLGQDKKIFWQFLKIIFMTLSEL